MAQPFDCLCGTPTCRGRIAGARDMTPAQLDGLWLNGHIRELLEERENAAPKKKQANGTHATAITLAAAAVNGNGNGNGTASANGHTDTLRPATAGAAAVDADKTVLALRDALSHAEKVVDAARLALVSYVEALQVAGLGNTGSGKQATNGDRDGADHAALPAGAQRRGPTSRELSGEMGGDTPVHV